MAFAPDILESVLAHIVVVESVLAHIDVVDLVRTFLVCGHVPFVLRFLFPCAGMTVVDTVAGTVVVEVVAVEAVGGKVIDIVVVAEVVENSFGGGQPPQYQGQNPYQNPHYSNTTKRFANENYCWTHGHDLPDIVEAVGGKVIDIVVAAEVVENIVGGG